MPKPDPSLLDPARYPFQCSIEPRFADLDLNRHINNVAIASFLEDSRVRFQRASGYNDGYADFASMIASIAIEYLAEGHYPEQLTVHGAVEDMGRTSYRFVQLLMQGERVIGFARSILVAVGTDGPVLLPDAFRRTGDQWRLRP